MNQGVFRPEGVQKSAIYARRSIFRKRDKIRSKQGAEIKRLSIDKNLGVIESRSCTVPQPQHSSNKHWCLMSRNPIVLLATALVLFAWGGSSEAGTYQFTGPAVAPHVGPVVALPQWIRGKEVSFDNDRDAMTGLSMPGQINPWDGNGGLANGRLLQPTTNISSPPGFQIDAIAVHVDTLTPDLLADNAHLLFSIDDRAHTSTGGAISIPLIGPLTTTGGLTIGGAAEISFEQAGNFAAVATTGVWATASQISNMLDPADLDGLDLFGNEPVTAANAAGSGDTNKFSVDSDAAATTTMGAFAVWDYNQLTGVTSGYLAHAAMTSAVRSLLAIPTAGGPDDAAFNLDALMVYEALGGSSRVFEDDDIVVFSIQQIVNPSGGFWATGSELFVLDGTGNIDYLTHGGHVWDKQFAEQFLQLQVGGDLVQLDLNALEAVGTPEPSTVVLAGLGIVGVVAFGRRRSR